MSIHRPKDPPKGVFPHKTALTSLCRLINLANLTIWMHIHDQITSFVHLLNVISYSWCKYLLLSLFVAQLTIAAILFCLFVSPSFLCLAVFLSFCLVMLPFCLSVVLSFCFSVLLSCCFTVSVLAHHTSSLIHLNSS